MQRGKKLVLAISVLLVVLPSALATQEIDISTDQETINADGDTLNLDYGNLETDKISELEITNNGSTVNSYDSAEEELFFQYNDSLTGEENLTLNIIHENGDLATQNIQKNLTRYNTEFKGFFRDSEKIKRHVYYRELEDVKVKIAVTKTNGNRTWSSSGLLGEDFEITSEGTGADLRLTGSSSSPYMFEFSSVPKMDVGEKEFKLSMVNGPEINEFIIEKRAIFEGKILTKKGTGQEAEFELVDDSISKFKTDNDGYFFKLLESGSVNRKLKLDLGEVTTTFSNITVSSNEKENIRYEFYKGLEASEVETEKLVKPVNLIAFSSNYPVNIDETSITMNYNTSGINPEDIEVYECSYWDFFGEECRVEWEKKEDIDNKELIGKVDVRNLETKGDGDYGLKSAYMAAVEYERPSLELEDSFSLSKTSYNIDDNLILEGNIKNSKNQKPVKNAQIEIELINEDNESIRAVKTGEDSQKTNEKGFFSFPPVQIPDTPGNYSLKLEASKAGFNNLSTTYDESLKVTQKVDISLDAPDKELKPGERVTSVLTIENTGQADINNIEIEEKNIESDHYTLTPQAIGKITAGSSKTVTLMSILPSDYCENIECGRKQFNIKVEGESGGKSVNADSSLRISEPKSTPGAENQTEKEENTTKDSENSENSSSADTGMSGNSDSEDSRNLTKFTGQFMEENVNLKTGLAFLLVILLGLVVAVRRKKKKTNRQSKSKESKQKETPVNREKSSKVKAVLKKFPGVLPSFKMPDLSLGSKTGKPASPAVGQEQKGEDDGAGIVGNETGYDEKKVPEIDSSDSRRSKFSKPKISAGETYSTEPKKKERDNEKENNSSVEKGNENEDLVCLKCGESFDTEIAFRLHGKHHH